MKIGLLGYGKMGKAIEKIAVKRGHTIVLKIDSKNQKNLNVSSFDAVDVAIDFSLPNTAHQNIEHALKAKTPVVCGTTGWLEHLPAVTELCKAQHTAFLYASNFSLGVNLFFELNKKLTELMANYPEYEVAVKETHHTEKIDAPSGTALSLANQILEKNKVKSNWVLGQSNHPEELGIESLRKAKVPGTHKITYTAQVDTISIKHTAHSRDGFALGAVIAAEWILTKKGVFSMKDVLQSK